MAVEFKSRTFSINPLSEEQLKSFKSDIEWIPEIETKKFPLVINFVKEIIQKKTEREIVSMYKKMVQEKLASNYISAAACHRIIYYFMKAFTDETYKEDTPEIIFNDILKLGFKSEKIQTVKQLLEIIKKEANWYEIYKLKESAIGGVFPSLSGIGTTEELRGVFSRELKYGEKADEYIKDIKIDKTYTTVPIISVAISLDSGTPDKFCFHASPDSIEWLIEKLRASLYKVKMLKNSNKIIKEN